MTTDLVFFVLAFDRPQDDTMFNSLHHLVHCLHLHIIHTLVS